jgi:hypothetical protein
LFTLHEEDSKNTMLQIQQLTTTESEYITCEQQQQIHGGSSDDSSVTSESLWYFYAEGDLNISKSKNGENVKFTPSNHSGDYSTYSLDPDSGHINKTRVNVPSNDDN